MIGLLLVCTRFFGYYLYHILIFFIEFQPFDYVLVTALPSTGEPIISCTCTTFTLIAGNLVNQVSSPADLQHGWDGISCCHCRLMADILSIYPMKYTSTRKVVAPTYLNSDWVSDGRLKEDDKNLKLISKGSVSKFCVVASDLSVVFITDFCKKSGDKRVVTCHNSRCMMGRSKGRELKSLLNSSDICTHLQQYRDMLLDAESIEIGEDAFESEVPIEDEREDDNDDNEDNENNDDEIDDQCELPQNVCNLYF